MSLFRIVSKMDCQNKNVATAVIQWNKTYLSEQQTTYIGIWLLQNTVFLQKFGLLKMCDERLAE